MHNRLDVVRHRATGGGRHIKRLSRRAKRTVAAVALLLTAGGATTWSMVGNSAQHLDPSALAGDGYGVTSSAASDRTADRASRSRGDAPTPTGTAPKTATTTPATAKPTTGASATPTKKAAPPPPGYLLPMASFELTSCYGPRWGTVHQGIDFANVAGTPIRAAHAGTVIMAGDNGDGYGRKVVIDHGGWYTLYGHAERVAVSVGQKVSTGQTISYEGSTGDSTGPHLHFEVWTDLWVRIDPAPWLRAHGLPLNGC